MAAKIEKRPVSAVNLLVGAGLNIFETSTLGQPFEVIKTQMAANRGDGMPTSISKIFQRGGVFGFYQGLIPWAWFEAATKGSVLIFAASEIEYRCKQVGLSSGATGVLAGMGGGIAQAYATMGLTTTMKTAEITRAKGGDAVGKSTMQVAYDIYKKEGIRGLNKGVNAVALRQCTNWGSRFGFSRVAEDMMRGPDPKAPLSTEKKIIASAIGGALGCWNQPIEVIRVEMQSQLKTPGRPERMTIVTAAKWIYQNNGILGFYRGVTPRIGLGIWQTICMVYGGDVVKAWIAKP
ncbi:mitochondrial carrier domain-containing protein [Gorgonomyces haynaldii]|nr:mitochondrial carrier domain-containing protein [Gorgonomyces haynaldii]